MSLEDVVAPALADPGAADYASLRQARAGWVSLAVLFGGMMLLALAAVAIPAAVRRWVPGTWDEVYAAAGREAPLAGPLGRDAGGVAAPGASRTRPGPSGLIARGTAWGRA